MEEKEAAARFWIQDASGQRLVDSGALSVPSRQYRFIFHWKPHKKYHFGVLSRRGLEFVTEAVAPSKETSLPQLRLYLPYISQSTERLPQDETSVTAVTNATMTLTAFIENTLDVPLSVTTEIVVPGELSERLSHASLKTFAWKSCQKSERWSHQIPIHIPDCAGVPSIIYATAIWTVSGETRVTTSALKVLPQRPERIAGTVRLREVWMPTDPFGRIDRRNRPDTLIVQKPALNALRRFLGTPAKRTSFLEPVSYQTAILENLGEGAIHLLVSCRVVGEFSDETVSALAPPNLVSGGAGRTMAFVGIAGSSEARAILPLFLDWRTAMPGRYRRVLSVRVWGADQPFLQKDFPLEVVQPSMLSAVVVGVICLVAVALLIFLILRGRRFFERFQTRELVFVALFATTIFATVTVPITILSNVIAAFCGPFSVLLTGLLNEIVYYALLVAFLALVPRFGAVAMLLGVRFLLNGLILGQLSVPVFLSVTVHIVVLEAACFLTGFTSGRSVLSPLARGERASLWGPAVILGVADAFILWTDYLLAMQLFRLFYASWYLALVIFVDGFFYTFLGVRVGARLSRHLGRIAP